MHRYVNAAALTSSNHMSWKFESNAQAEEVLNLITPQTKAGLVIIKWNPKIGGHEQLRQ